MRTVRALLDAGANPRGRMDDSEPDRRRPSESPLHHVAQSLAEVAKILIAAGADANATDNLGCTPLPLHVAAVHGRLDKVRLLLDCGATAAHWPAAAAAAAEGGGEACRRRRLCRLVLPRLSGRG